MNHLSKGSCLLVLKIGDVVSVYRNLRTGNFSILKNGRVVKRADGIIITQAKFIVSQKGKERVLKEKRKNVHAMIRGLYMGYDYIMDTSHLTECYYNPYKTETFINKNTGQPIESAKFVYFKGDKAYFG